jgi:hypothetical protein
MAAPPELRSELSTDAQQYDRWFDEAAAAYDVPADLLRSIAMVETRWTQVAPEAAGKPSHHQLQHDQTGAPLEQAESQSESQDAAQDLPPVYGIMGLRDDAHFGHSLIDAAGLIGRTPGELARDPHLNILGAAALLHSLGRGNSATTPLEAWEAAAARFSGIPQPEIARVYTYDVFNGLMQGRASPAYRVSPHAVSLERIYGVALLSTLSAPRIVVPVEAARAGRVSTLSADYSPALWNAAASCDYTVGRTVAITNITIHTTQGSYASTISWFQDCSSQVSAHYVVRSSDGQITQMVLEKDKAWHVGSENGYTIGIEHEGFIDNPTAWYTDAMYNASALLTRDICNSYGFDKTRIYDGSLGWNAVISDHATYVAKGHVNYPNQTHQDPGSGWNWAKYKSLVAGSTGSSSQLLGNAGFESGNVSWVTAASTDITTSSTYAPHSGAWYAWLGGWATAHTDYMYQTVTIPSTATAATLSFYLRVTTAETTTTSAFDTLKVQLRDTSNNLVTQLVSLSNLSASPSYSLKSFDISAYKGRTLRVYFEAVNDNGNQTSFLVDDAALQITQ